MAKVIRFDRAALDAEFAAFEALQAEYHGIEHLGHVWWMDGTSGEGVIKLDTGISFYCHFSAIVGIDKNNYAYPIDSDVPTLSRYGCEQVRVKVIPYVSYGSGIMAQQVEII